MTLHESLAANLGNPAKRRKYLARGQAAVGNTSRNACAATASQPYLELGIIHSVYISTELWIDERGIKHPGLVDTLKRTRLFNASANRKDVKKFDLVVCEDGNGNKRSDHVWHAMDDGDGKGNYKCFDNQSGKITIRRLDGLDGKTPMRGRLRLN